jgi:hypothetical protein
VRANRLKRTPWTRRHALTLLGKVGVKSPNAVYRRLRKRWANDPKLPAELKVHIVLCGAVCEWLEDLAQLQVIRCLERQTRYNESCATENVLSSILPNIATDMGAILALCRVGYDVQARSLVRSFIERIDLLICIKLDADFASIFLSAGSFEESRGFFYRNVSGGKLAKKARELFRQNYPDADFIYDWTLFEWRKDTNLMLASAVHGNHTVALLSLFPNLGRGRSNAIGLGGHPTNSSNRTISMLLTACMPLHFLFADYPYDEVLDYLRDAKLDTAEMRDYQAYRGLLLTFPLVDAWLQDLKAAIRDFPPDNPE